MWIFFVPFSWLQISTVDLIFPDHWIKIKVSRCDKFYFFAQIFIFDKCFIFICGEVFASFITSDKSFESLRIFSLKLPREYIEINFIFTILG